EYTTLGKTELKISRVGFGALPIQRTPLKRAVSILRYALDNGINFFDTARGYTDSEKKLGIAFKGKRNKVVFATKVHCQTKQELLKLTEESLKQLKTDYIDILQLHNPENLPDPQDENSVYTGLKEAQKKGMTRFIGVTAHKFTNVKAAIKSGLYDVVQYPVSALSEEKEIKLVKLAKNYNTGFVAMKPLCGGLLTDIEIAFSFLWQFDNLVPIWGIQRMKELKAILKLAENPPSFDETMRKKILKEKRTLGRIFCRGCGYCMPCPAEIPIPMAARMKFLLRRAPYKNFLTSDWQKRMLRILNCQNCGNCLSKCPYNLNPPELLKEMFADYIDFAKNKGITIMRSEK
ncbi:MAG: aldo/keto reductase, partial [bacterium]|nr:aldo/keto reductase [bacterium]